MRAVSSLAAASLFAVFLSSGAFAQTVRLRGPVETMNGAVMTVKSRDGDVTVKLAENWTVAGRGPAKLSDIKAGDFVGVAATPTTGGGLRAVEIFIFPAGVKAGEGHYAWDLLPEGTMTNAVVAEKAQAVSGESLRLVYQGGEKTIAVPPEAIITQSAAAEKSEVKPGAVVFVSAQRQPDGSLLASRVTVNKEGARAP